MSISANMSLILPGVGITNGPQWASDLNTSLTLIDQHDHSSGSGVQVTPDGLDISSALSMQSNNLVDTNSVRFISNASPLAGGADLQAVYVSDVDLYYNDGNGNQVRITQGGGVAGTPGSISNLTSPASANYVAGSSVFVWESDSNTAADMDFGAAIMRNLTLGSFGLTLQPPTLSSNYSLTLPTLPASQKFMTLDASGVMSAPWEVDNITLEIASSTTLQVKAVGTAQIANLSVTAGKIANATITGTQVSNNINLPGNTVQENGKNVVVSNTNASASLAIIRGTISAAGAISAGEGFTVNHTGAGAYSVTFTTAFADFPSVVATPVTNLQRAALAPTITTTGCNFILFSTSTGTATDTIFSFIVIGQRT